MQLPQQQSIFTGLQKLWLNLYMLAMTERDIYLNILIEFSKDRNHPVEREATKLRVADMRKFGVLNSGLLLGVAHRKFALIKDIDDFRCNNGSSLL
ncbi:MAG: hypothetical protein PHW13_11750 [Methylococcales bacterium]|nr:hypothetical protein [Methylococcales bacterium]